MLDRIGDHGGKHGTLWRVAAMVFLLLASSAQSQDRGDSSGRSPRSDRSSRRSAAEEAAKPAEETRLSTSAFRAGLRKRGLTGLLDLHLMDFPPKGRLATVLMRRDLKLSQFSDASLPRETRRDALTSANRLLEEAIREAPDDARRFKWMFDLAHSLIYQEAEPYYSSIMYRGGGGDDRLKLQALAARALSNAENLINALTAEYERIDNLSLREFDRLERSGEVERLDRLMPQAAYLRAWALFYDAVPRDDDDATRSGRLRKILQYLEENPGLLTTPHVESKVQIQAYLLQGMTQRLLNDHAVSRDALSRAVTLSNRLVDRAERDSLRWAELLAHIEAVRNDVEDEKFTDAMTNIKSFRRFVSDECAGEFQYEFLAAMLERWMHLERAKGATSNSSARERYLRESWQVVLAVRQRFPNQVAEINAVLFGDLDPSRDSASLDPVETAATVAGMLTQADQFADRADELLANAADVGQAFVEKAPREAGPIIPEIIYNVAVARYRLQEHGAAARMFLKLVKEHPRYSSGRRAADFAVELAFSFYDQNADEISAGGAQEVVAFYRDALETLLQSYPDFESARYWRFYYAQLLMELEAFTEAANQFAQVDVNHEQYLRGVFLRLKCLAESLKGVDPDAAGVASVNRQVEEFNDVRRMLQVLLTSYGQADSASANDDDRLRRSLAARTRLIDAEVQLLPVLAAPSRALESLVGFEKDFSDFPNLFGDLWRIRLLSFEKLGQIEDAAKAIPAFIAADPRHAGPTLQRLYEELWMELESQVEAVVLTPEQGISMQKALLAELLADHIYDWSMRKDSTLNLEERQFLRVQQARAKLAAGKYEMARKLFESAGAKPALPEDRNRPLSVELEVGYAESIFYMHDFELALLKFNHLATRLPA
ncbi:MAG: tetratricopeptide repeat protein, partial [Phycisphaerae bacterium]